MAEELPWCIPRVLRLDDVSLLRADETVFYAMVDGWRAQMLARGLAVDTNQGAVSRPRDRLDRHQYLRRLGRGVPRHETGSPGAGSTLGLGLGSGKGTE